MDFYDCYRNPTPDDRKEIAAMLVEAYPQLGHADEWANFIQTGYLDRRWGYIKMMIKKRSLGMTSKDTYEKQ